MQTLLGTALMAVFALYGLGYFGLFNLPHPDDLLASRTPQTQSAVTAPSHALSFTERVSATNASAAEAPAANSKLTDRVSSRAAG